jgi:type IV pilus assembly protein PilY1
MNALHLRISIRQRLHAIRAAIRLPALAILVMLLSLPANAGITLPTDPLTTSSRVPPNILFILDDSGSMAFNYLANPQVTQICRRNTNGSCQVSNNSVLNDITNLSYIGNTIYYNPATTYTPWTNPSGSLMTAGTSYGAVFGDFNKASGTTINLADTNSCGKFDVNNNGTPNTTVCGGIQTFYVPKDVNSNNTGYLGNVSNYYRYQLLNETTIQRGEFGVVTTANRCDSSQAPASLGWINCVSVTPTGRSNAAAEAANYATWFSYHRTRIKSAKAGAGKVFSDLGSDVRVGFRTIWSRNNLDIPVADGNQGLFMDRAASGTATATTARTTWYTRLYNAVGYNGTPLPSALDGAGKYFSDSSASGPYGPESGVDQYACRQNFTILTTDGYWNGSSVSVGNQDNTDGADYSGPNGTPAPYGYTASAPYKDGYSNSLADIAMRYWKTDLRDTLDNVVPTSGADPAFWQHMVTFGISIGARGTLDPATDLPRLTAGTIGWPDPQTGYTGNNDILERVDDLWHASVNGHGSFLNAADPDAFKTGLSAALSAITRRTSSFSNVSATSTSLDAGTLVFQASYVSGLWIGDLKAYSAVDANMSSTPSWSASAGIPSSDKRKIFTWNGTAGASFPTATQLASLARTTAPAISAADNAAYVAGSTDNEIRNGGAMRNRFIEQDSVIRDALLGDIVGSSPAYSSDTKTVYAGANDGMLHAFDAATGVEQFAYVPSAINFSDLANLSSPKYSHRYFVDGPVILSTRTQTPSKTILVGALGKGGKGVYALDVTSPASFSASKVKWERYGEAGDAEANNVGLVQARPFIAKLNDGTTALVVANGVNSANDQAVLLVYNLETGALIRQISTATGSSSAPNGLSGATGWDGDGNGTVDYVYAGDILGNVWKFDLSAATSASWSVANSAKPLFTATYPVGTGSTVQAISANMTVALNPSTYDVWLFFGTGRFMTAGDITDKSVQSLYGIIDTSNATSNATLARSALTSRAITVTGAASGYPVRGFQPNAVLPPGSKGWYINLLTPPSTAQGERIVTEAQLLNTTLVVSSIIPTLNACQSDGIGYINALEAFTGTGSTQSFFDLDADGNFANDKVGGLPVGSVNLGVGMPTLANIMRGKLVVGGSGGKLGNANIAEIRNTGRISWREIIRD